MNAACQREDSVLDAAPSFGESVVVMIAWLAVVVLGLTGRRRTAAAIAFISLTLALLVLLVVLVVLIQQAMPLLQYLSRRACPVPALR